MPDSGPSTVGRALGALGVDLGERRCARINAAVLAATSDSPPSTSASWTDLPELEPVTREARTTFEALALVEPWGWVDPASSRALPFWLQLFPDLEIVVCVRDPLELASELEAEGTTVPEALDLWRTYYAQVDQFRDRAVVTDLARYGEDPQQELERVASELGLSPSTTELAHAAAAIGVVPVNRSLVEAELPENVARLYARLLETNVLERTVIAAQKLEIANLRRELERAKGRIVDLRSQVEAHLGWQRERAEIMTGFENQLLDRDVELKRAYDENEWRRGTESALRKESKSLREENQWLLEKEEEAREQLESIQQTRLWRLGERYWALRDRVRGAGPRQR
jgi:hypothetical protein